MLVDSICWEFSVKPLAPTWITTLKGGGLGLTGGSTHNIRNAEQTRLRDMHQIATNRIVAIHKNGLLSIRSPKPRITKGSFV